MLAPDIPYIPISKSGGAMQNSGAFDVGVGSFASPPPSDTSVHRWKADFADADPLVWSGKLAYLRRALAKPRAAEYEPNDRSHETDRLRLLAFRPGTRLFPGSDMIRVLEARD
jgi:hypothetical protein